jgi:hypothetical protein
VRPESSAVRRGFCCNLQQTKKKPRLLLAYGKSAAYDRRIGGGLFIGLSMASYCGRFPAVGTVTRRSTPKCILESSASVLAGHSSSSAKICCVCARLLTALSALRQLPLGFEELDVYVTSGPAVYGSCCLSIRNRELLLALPHPRGGQCTDFVLTFALRDSVRYVVTLPGT